MVKVTKEVNEHAKIIWDYHLMNHKLKKVDLIFVLGGSHIQVAEYAADLYIQGLASLVIITGGLSQYAKKLWGKSEAEAFADIFVEKGVPKNKLLLEKKSTNTGENVINAKRLLAKMKINPKKVVAVHKPFMERRTYATVRKFWPEIEVSVTSPPIPYEKYEIEGRTRADLVNAIVGYLQRIKEYPKKGYQIEQKIPLRVWKAYERLVELGFTNKLI